MGALIYKHEAYAVVGAAMEVYNQLGSGFLEAVYQEALGLEFAAREIPFQAQQRITIHYKGQPLNQVYIADFVTHKAIIVEIKAIKQLGPNQQAQTLNYLKATGFQLGLLINFGNPDGVDWRRIVQTRSRGSTG